MPPLRSFQEEAGHLPRCVSAAAFASKAHLSVELANAPEEGERGREKDWRGRPEGESCLYALLSKQDSVVNRPGVQNSPGLD